MERPITPPTVADFWAYAKENPDEMSKIIEFAHDPAPSGKYRHWHTLRFVDPPEGLSSEQWWFAIKLARAFLLKPIPLRASDGSYFKVGLPDPAMEMLQRIDQELAGRIEIAEQVTNRETRDRYLVNSLIDEAITSSQLEGAATSHRVAKDMLRSSRPPRSRDEQMILNNFRAMEYVRANRHDPVTVERLIELHRILTTDTLDDPNKVGRIRGTDDNVRVIDTLDDAVLHVPPPAEQLPLRLGLLCRFANGEKSLAFIHPVIRAVLTHFWLAYEHPFCDGNGRTARALFYWVMLKQGYWLCEYISISSVVKASPGKYKRAYLYAETDENDTTYFVLFHLKIIHKAIDHLERHLERKAKELRTTERLLHESARFNHRQIALLGHALRHPDARYTIRSHQRSHRVAYQTARTDLLQLARHSLLEQKKAGRGYVFAVPGELADKLGTDLS